MNRRGDRRVFLGWDRPVVDGVVDHLVSGRDTGPGKPLDLKDVLVVVPTRQAGRRLREALAQWCEEHGTCLLSATVVTPDYFFRPERMPSNTAGPVATRMMWIEILMHSDFSELATLFPGQTEQRTFQWALNTAEILENLRKELSDGGLTVTGVVENHADSLEELDRWQELTKLEQMYLAGLKKKDLKDSCEAKIELVAGCAVDPPINRVVVAAVPDPSLLALKALKRVAETTDVEILVHAPETKKADMNPWGQPLSAHWLKAHIDIPDPAGNVFLEATPAEQSQRLVREIAGSSGEFESGEIAIGVPDVSLIPFVQNDLGTQGLPSFDPADRAVCEHALGRLARAVLMLVQDRSYEAVAALLRHPDVAASLEDMQGLKTTEILEQLDKFQNFYLPASLDQMPAPFEKNPRGTTESRDDFTTLGSALKIVGDMAATFENSDFETAWRGLLQRVYANRRIDRSKTRDAEFENAAMALDRVLREFRGPADSGHDAVRLSAVFVRQLERTRFHRERRGEVIDLEGWLELPWNDRPFLVVAGLNDEFVPGGGMSDAFLPDSLRARLGLRDDQARFARDIFLMTGMIESRRSFGRACFIVGKAGDSGDPLKPSRLLFRCPDRELPARVGKLLASIEDQRPRPAVEVIFRLRPGDAEKKTDFVKHRHISVTALRDYLECPFRFYLKHVLGMEECNDGKTGLDQLDFGIIVHEVLKVMGRDRSLWACPDHAKLGVALADLAEKHVVGRFGAPLPLAVHISLMAAVQRLRALARVQVELVEQGWEIVEAEGGDGGESSRWRLERRGFVVSGRIDRIDRDRDTGRIRIYDYKTSDNADLPASMHLVLRRDNAPEWNRITTYRQLKSGLRPQDRQWIDLQLPLYAMICGKDGAFADMGGLQVAYFHLPKAISRTGVYVWEDFGAEHIESAGLCLDGVLVNIGRNVFWPPAASVKHDDFEKFFYLCPEDGIDRGGFES